MSVVPAQDESVSDMVRRNQLTMRTFHTGGVAGDDMV